MRFQETETPGIFWDTQNKGYYYEDPIEFEFVGIFDTEEEASEKLIKITSEIKW